MKTLYDALREIKESYYHININIESLFGSERANENCHAFIRDHFRRGKKNGIFHIPNKFSNEYHKHEKQQHTVSLYLLGLLLEDSFHERFENELNKHFDISGWYDYKYTWYLACLYHDMLNFIEYSDCFDDELLRVSSSELFNRKYTFLRFDKNIYINYLKYRKDCGSSEHGIMAGVDLFKRLDHSFSRATARYDWKASPIYTKDNINWRREHVPHFAYVCDAICCHNIWLANEKDKDACENYSKHQLESLIVHSDSDKLQLKKYPLQFLLCLLDTIEPLKKFGELESIEVFKNIYIDINPSSITLGWTDVIKQQPSFFKWMESISSLKNWMGINVGTCYSKDGNCFIKLSFVEEVLENV